MIVNLRTRREVRNHASSLMQILKRMIDFFGSLFLMAILLPVYVVVALTICVSDGFPIIYRRRVIGTEGEFDAFKFRSMRPDADAVLEQDAQLRERFSMNFKLRSDPRVTKFGSFLRKYSLDELPQLFNVLIGQMSLVGPRMITSQELAKYGEYDKLLLTVKPGLTGYWQVHGRQELSYPERVRMDVDYIQSWRLLNDIKILALTPLRVIRGKGAY